MIKKTLFFALALLLLTASQLFAGDVPQFKQSDFPETITFAGVKHHLAFKEGNDKGPYILEYIPEGETLEKWTTLFAIRLEGHDLTPLQRAATFANHLEKRGFKNAVFQSKDKKDVVLDFATWPEDSSFYEHNLWRYFKPEKGLISYQYARRFYMPDSSMEQIKEYMMSKSKVVNEMFEFPLPPTP
ncbi:hypothetical protein [Salidesulfovibrio onnuriiensis]|uniref:hypothetical protein n=1 Tax=Salidesulfovibrio onnuriiensis TaxID=2583823 RepID=UPI0011C908A6|nr:hypothetical protein [Salidesulfovibrio onnuriiensis]